MSPLAWRHVDVREAFEVVFRRGDAYEGHVSGVEDGRAWAVEYSIELRPDRTTRSARVRCSDGDGTRETAIAADGKGNWNVDGAPAPQLEGLLDVDLEASAMTNAFPVARLALPRGERVQAPAAWVRLHTNAVERLEQTYQRVDERSYDYESPAFGFACRLVYGDDGFVLDYPGIAVRHSGAVG